MIDILLLEDNPLDAELLSRELHRAEVRFTIQRVETELAFRTRLTTEPLPDVILADYHLPSFDGRAALQIARDLVPQIPFLFVSGSIGEEQAVDALRAGANDYILKDRPSRLPSAIERCIEDRRRNEARLRAESRFRLAASATRDVIWELDLETLQLEVSEPLRSEWGHERLSGLDQQWWLAQIHPDDRERVVSALGNCLASPAKHLVIEYRFQRGNGTFGHALDRMTVVRLADGTPFQIVGAMQDVTARKEAENALAEAQRMAKIGRWSIDLNSNEIDWSEEVYRILGRAVGTPPSFEAMIQAAHPDDRDAVMAVVWVPPSREPIETRIRIVRPDGSIRIVQSCFRYVFDQGKATRRIGTLQDVTEIVGAEETIRTLRLQAEIILDHAGDGIIAVDRDGLVTRINRAASQMLGTSPAEVVNQARLHDAFHYMQPDGTPYSESECPIMRCLFEGRAGSGDEVFWRKDRTPVYVHYTVSPIDVDGLVITIQDMTERLRLQRQLEQSERVSELGRVAATIAHEFNNVLMGAQPFADQIRKRAQNPQIIEWAGRILDAIKRGRAVTQEILAASRSSPTVPELVDVAEWLKSRRDELRELIPSGIELHFDLEELLYVSCDLLQLQQVITNLVINARDALPKGGRIEIRAWRSDGGIRIEIADNGTGIRPDVLPNIFEPLYTTKAHGTGLGLAVVRQLIERSGGAVTAESELGRGSTFIIMFPEENADIASA